MANKKTTPKRSLLLIGAQPDAIKVMQILLEKEGYKVQVADTPAAGVDLLAHKPQAVQLCLVDLVKIDDAEPLYNALAGRDQDDADADAASEDETVVNGDLADTGVPILIIAQSEEEGRQALEASGLFGEYLVKPYDKSELLDKVRQFTDK